MSMRFVRALLSSMAVLSLAAVSLPAQSNDAKKDPDQIGNRDVTRV